MRRQHGITDMIKRRRRADVEKQGIGNGNKRKTERGKMEMRKLSIDDV